MTNPTVSKYHLQLESEQFGSLEKAGSFVYQDYEPADNQSTTYVESLALKLRLPITGQNGKKYIRCISDFLMAVRTTSTNKIAWLLGADNFYSGPYGHKIAQATLKALMAEKHLALFQKSSKRDKLARLYSVDKNICPDSLRFRPHGKGPLVIVNSKKRLSAGGKQVGGKRIARKGFLPEIKRLEDQVSGIKAKMLKEPLRDTSGHYFASCRRVFNNGSLKAGGRLYGHWQGRSEVERLEMTIAGEPVVEIDIKACFLSIASAQASTKSRLSTDPYHMVSFVKYSEDEETRIRNRNAAKRLINSYFFKPGEPTKFPKGKKDKATGKTLSFKKEFQLTHPVAYYMDRIHNAFPFLKEAQADGMSLMYQESEIMIEAIETLLRQDVVSYPVHDCLIVKVKDQDIAIEAIQQSMINHLGITPSIDVSWLSDDKQIENRIVSFEEGNLTNNKFNNDHLVPNVLSDDFDVIDDY